MRRSLPAVLLYAFCSTTTCPVVAEESEAPEKPARKQTLIEIGKETTDITEPLDAEGYVDYVEAVNQRMSKGVTAKNNFEVVVRRVMGPDEINEADREEYFRRLGIPVPPVDGDYLKGFLAFRRSKNPTAAETDALYAVEERISAAPWRAADFPEAAKWLAEMETQLDAVVEGSNRPRNYAPYLSGPFDAESPGPRMIAVLLPSVQEQRTFARALEKRAMLRIGEGRLDEAWGDLQAMHRIAHHNASGVTLIESLVGIAIEGLAFPAESALLASPKATPAQLRRYYDDLAKLPPLPSMADRIDIGERWMGLDCVTSIGRRNVKDLFEMLNVINQLSDSGTRPRVPVGLVFVSDDAGEKPMGQPLEYTIDWNVTLRLMNGWYDRLVAAAREPDFAKRERMFEAIDTDLKKLAADSRDPAKLLFRLAGNPKPREELGRMIGRILVALLIPAIDSARRAEDRAIAHRDVLRLGFALQLYRSENGRSPRTLDQLVPRYTKAVPVDAMTGEALSYGPTKAGFVLYSLGRNRVDDGGRGYDDSERAGTDPGWDDIVVRVGQ